MRLNPSIALVFAVLIAVAATHPLAGQTHSTCSISIIDVCWIGGVGDWHDPSNWDTGEVPVIFEYYFFTISSR